MRVLILANNDVGLYQFRRELIEKLLEENEVYISLPYGDLVDPLKEMGCIFIDTSVDRRGINPVTDLKLFFIYIKIIKQTKPDLVITYTIKPNIYGGLVCRIYRISYAMNITGLGTAFEKDGLLRKIVTIMYKVASKNAKVVFFENEENNKLFVTEGIVRENQTYRLNGAGVNLNKYKVTEYPKGDTIKFLFMGRVMAEKGINELFRAMKKLVDDGVKCELDVLGSYEEDYKKIIEEYESEGWLHFHGYQKDVRPFIERCHCFVLPSWHEGMANTNLECAASGRPVITSNTHGCLEAVIDGETGYLVEKKNVNELYKIMKKFTNLTYDERKDMGISGRKHMENVFDKNKVIEETLNKIW